MTNNRKPRHRAGICDLCTMPVDPDAATTYFQREGDLTGHDQCILAYHQRREAQLVEVVAAHREAHRAEVTALWSDSWADSAWVDSATWTADPRWAEKGQT